MECLDCGAENRADQRFCGQCGTSFGRVCPSCRTGNDADNRFCGQCGERLEEGRDGDPAVEQQAGAVPETEVRIVSVLFVDLVGFTEVAEGRDPERVRELLDAYFARARRVVERYGGTVEKFIGDAVMAVWGTPVAHDDDAERAVRAALDLVDEVVALADELPLDGLRARAGVVTGRVAVTIGAEGQGMVAGDRVNTAARIQSVAPPGGVLVDEATQSATSTAIAYEDAGSHEVKGKDEVVRTWRATRVVARRGGAVRAQGLEPPFVGREREIRLLRDVHETVAEQETAALISVVGQAGIGKSRLAWEFEKHLDGLVETVYWHRGRCLAYGDGVAYTALAEMVRDRADIIEDEEQVTARRKLEHAVAQHVVDEDDRAFVLPRLAHLLGLEERTAPDQADLFAGWRLFFERLADQHPVVLVFEDLQWADGGLLDFIEHLLDWSRDRPILVLTLARPELGDRIDWGARVRNLTSIHLGPLADDAMDQLLVGLVPGLPDKLRSRIAGQAEGVPLYAVETVRMLLDRGEVVQGADGYVPAGEIDELAVPATLQTLVSARLDSLDQQARDLVQHAAVLGQSFTREGLVALSGLDEEVLEQRLRSLRSRDLVGIEAGERGPARGRYTFLQTMVRTVAYETLSRHERKRRHLAAARHLEETSSADELAEVIANHHLDAYRADPEGDDADTVREDAIAALHRAADRAESLAAVDEALRCCDRIAELTVDPVERGEALLRAGDFAERAGRPDEAVERLRDAATLLAAEGESQQEALAQAYLARVEFEQGRGAEAVERLGAAVSRLDPDRAPVEYARLAAELARQLVFLGRPDEALMHVESALAAAERRRVLDVLTDALNTKALILLQRGRSEEGLALLRHAYDLSEDAPRFVANRTANNLNVFLLGRARWDEVREIAERELQRARRAGDARGELWMLSQLESLSFQQGRWDDAERYLEEAEASAARGRFTRDLVVNSRARLLIWRGEFEEAGQLLEARMARSVADEQERVNVGLHRVALLERLGRHEEAVEAALELTEEAPARAGMVGLIAQLAIPSAIATGDTAAASLLRSRAAEYGDAANVVHDAHLRHNVARIAAAGGGPEAEAMFRESVRRSAELGMPVLRAVAQLDLAEWYLDHDRPDDAVPLLDEAEASFAEMGARPDLERIHELRATISTSGS